MLLLKPGDYYTQRNNAYKPFEACMPTSWAMFCIANGFKDDLTKVVPDINQVDDWAMRELNTPEAIAFAKAKYPDLAKTYPPNQIHGMYHSWLEPKVFGHAISDFLPEALTFEDYCNEIDAGRALWTSGAFQGRSGPIDGHAIAIIGREPAGLDLGDPYGDFRLNYASVAGYAIPMNRQEFTEHLKPVNSLRKNAHVLRERK